ncbi:MAG: tRNA (adenosine(37)-N6)-dimethylallyltransferase MiaA [candidate division KSB1 bacterium]|nr:tRNA (adenosine(37)-N6)-dimethylallyltransferase MiaA [candidate division KSB1 bacterium]
MQSNDNLCALILAGPTGVGKTAVALELAKHVPAEIVSADSRQVYRYMDIGTAKPSIAVRGKIPHHFIDIRNPDEIYSAGEFGHDARQVIETILQRGKKWPIVVGGSGLYLRALLEGFFEPKVANLELRAQLKRRVGEEGSPALHAELARVDPNSAARLNLNDAHRIVRALEIYYTSGKTAGELWQQQSEPAKFAYRLLGLNMPRPALYQRINQRVEEMLAKGLIEECQRLLQMGYSPELNALRSVGYQEVFQFLREEISYAEMTDLIQRHSRQYAKRQLTWFRRMSGIEWVELSPDDSSKAIAERILKNFMCNGSVTGG